MSNPYFAVIEQMASVGITGLQDTDLLVDGKIHRFKPDDAKSKRAWYVLHEYAAKNGDLLLYGAFGDWGNPDVTHKVEPNSIRLSDAEREEFKKEKARRQKETTKKRKQQADKAALRAKAAWAKCEEEGTSEYLAKKQVKGYGVRYSKKNAVIIPVVDMGGVMHGLQVVHAFPRKTKSGDLIEKDFWPFGMDPKGHFHRIGEITNTGRNIILIVEGYATGASIHEATGLPVFIAFNAGNLVLVAKVVREAWPESEIFIAADDDYLTLKPIKNPGVTAAKKVAKAITAKIIVPQFKNRESQKWTDFNDLHVQEGLEQVKEQIMRAVYADESSDKPKSKPSVFAEIPDGQEWRYRMSYTQTGRPQANVNNAKLVLMNDERWQGVLQYNEFDYDIHKLKLPPFNDNPKLGDWDEVDTERLRCWLGEEYEFISSEKDTIAAVRVVAENFSVHPIKDYLESLVWDEIERLDYWMVDFLGAERNDYTIKVSSKFLIGAVARVYAVKGAGVKMDNVLILEGLQGEGKSTTIETLCGSGWFSETPFELGSKEGYQQLRGVWFQELAELDSFNKAESTKAKAFFSAKEDYYRPSYGRKAAKFPRQCVFVGSTNQDQYLKDVTGNRRYWPVKCTELNVGSLRAARDQLWAEAFHRYKNKEPHWVLPHEKALFTEQQEDRFQEDAWESRILDWLHDPEQRLKTEFTSADIMTGALKMTPDKMKPPEQTRVGLIMKRLGWKKGRRTKGYKGPTWVYLRPEDEQTYVDVDDPPI